jgi:hypothetical protein
VLPPSQDGNSPDGSQDASASGGSGNAASTNATVQEGSMEAGVYYINGYPSAYVYDYARGGENSPSLLPPPPPPHNFKPSNFISSCFCFAMDFATLGIFLHVHPFLNYGFFECASHSFRGFLSLNSQWQVNGMTILNMQVLMPGNFSPLYVTCSKNPPPPPPLCTLNLFCW